MTGVDFFFSFTLIINKSPLLSVSDSCGITYILVFWCFFFFTKMNMARAHTPTCACLCVSGTGIMLHTRLEQRSLQAAYFHLHTCPLSH